MHRGRLDLWLCFLLGAQVALIAEKLYGVVNWSWWWILAPGWVMIGLVLTFVIFFLLIGIIVSRYNNKRHLM